MEEPDPKKLEKLKYYRGEIKQEYDLLSGRVNSYVASQSFLCIAYASSMGNSNPHWANTFTFVFPIVLTLLGIAISIQAGKGINAAFRTIELWHEKQDRLFENDPSLKDYHLVRVNITSDSPLCFLFVVSFTYVYGFLSQVSLLIVLLFLIATGGLAGLLVKEHLILLKRINNE